MLGGADFDGVSVDVEAQVLHGAIVLLTRGMSKSAQLASARAEICLAQALFGVPSSSSGPCDGLEEGGTQV